METTLTSEQQLLNVAACVMQHTEVTRRHNGRGRAATYASNVDAIAGAARQLAEMVDAYFGEQETTITLTPLGRDYLRRLREQEKEAKDSKERGARASAWVCHRTRQP
jgi:hypothetical protein